LEERHIKITESLFIASIPISAYFLAYIFERGYCRFYKIPPIYIDISLMNIIATFVALVSTYALLFFFFNSVIYPAFSKIHRSIRFSVIKVTLVAFSLIGLGIVFNWSLETSLKIILPIIGFLVFLEFGFPLITQRKTAGYINKVDAQKEVDFRDEHYIDKFIQHYGFSIFSILYIFYIISMATYIAGGYNARFKTEHIISTDEPNKVYLRRYGEYSVSNIFDRENNQLSNHYVIEKNDNLSIKVEKIGQLKPHKSESLTKSSSGTTGKQVAP